MEALEQPGAVSFTVFGDPVPKGSMRPFTRRKGGEVVGVGMTAGNEKRARSWNAAVHAAAQAAARGGMRPLEGPLHMTIRFWLHRPKSAPKSRRVYPGKRPDLDKLVRGLLDPLTGILFVDDAQVVSLLAVKDYAPEDTALGADVKCWPMSEAPF